MSHFFSLVRLHREVLLRLESRDEIRELTLHREAYRDHCLMLKLFPALRQEWQSMACPVICTSEIVSVARRERLLSARRSSRRCGKVERVLCFPLFHTAVGLRSATLPALVVCSRAKSVAARC